jgi:hypothetical protein
LEARLEEPVALAKRASLSVTVLDGSTDLPDDLQRATAFFQGLSEEGFGGGLIGFDASARKKHPMSPVDDCSAPVCAEDDGVSGLALRIARAPIRNAEHRNAP